MPGLARLLPGVFERNWTRVMLVSLAVGVAGGTAAAAIETGLHVAIHLLSDPFLPSDRTAFFDFNIAYVLLPVTGGIFSAILCFFFIRRESRQGTELYIDSFHEQQGSLELKCPTVQAVAAIGVIGSGGSAGPEAPTAAVGASLGSLLSKVFKVRPRERVNFLVAGCAAGVGAIFHCPLGGAFFACDVLYSDPDLGHEALIPSLVASVSAYVTFISWIKHSGPLFPGLEQVQFSRPSELVAYAALGFLCVLGALLLRGSLRATRWLVRRLKVHRLFRPAVGGILCGLAAIFVPQVLDPRYELLHELLKGHTTDPSLLPRVSFTLLFIFVIARVVATGFTIGSGNAGGLLGPAIRIGGLCGAALAAALGDFFPVWTTHELQASLIAVGMSGVLVASMRVPLAGLVMVIEMTHCYGLIVPLMLTCSVAYLLGRSASICEVQVRNTLESPAYISQAMGNLLNELSVADASVPFSQTICLKLGMPVQEALEILKTRHLPFLPTADEQGIYRGLASRQTLENLAGGEQEELPLEGASLTWLDPLDSTTSASRALEYLLIERLPLLPVVASMEDLRYLGYATGKSVEEAFQVKVNSLLSPLRETMPEVADLLLNQDLGTVLRRLPGLTNTAEMQEMSVPEEVIGRTLVESDFRSRFSQQVVAIRRLDGTLVLPATAEDHFLEGDVLLVIPISG